MTVISCAEVPGNPASLQACLDLLQNPATGRVTFLIVGSEDKFSRTFEKSERLISRDYQNVANVVWLQNRSSLPQEMQQVLFSVHPNAAAVSFTVNRTPVTAIDPTPQNAIRLRKIDAALLAAIQASGN